MAAFTATTSSQEMLAATNPGWETVRIVNIGPNAVYVDFNVAAATTTGLKVDNFNFSEPALPIRRPPFTSITIIASVANQVSPNNTRYLVSPS